ncbi:unnamed protein product [Adineta ricciae]|uniref:G-protein coupled receptors family 1 profile domain-containing protein n=1 Tax=Adineta ricciae TaxID=249248 RepID=A0A814MDV7_ADIRI|nr:unnamed protein product [Adineta ricciae]CAF1377858.1 unnamed protein product [Adineta ricciae]
MGTIGNILNIVTFLSQDYRTKACILYLIFSSSINICFANLYLIIYLVAQYSGVNIIQTNRPMCKIFGYISVCSAAITATCLFLSTLDRCFSTSRTVRYRQLSNWSLAQRLLIITVLFLLISSIFSLIVYDLYNGMCTSAPGLGSIAVIVYANIFITLIPHGGMLICGIITWINMRQMTNRINPDSGASNATSAVQKMNRQLLILIFIEALVDIILEVQRNITATYNLITNSIEKSIERQQIEHFVIQLSIILYTVKQGMSFYIYCFCSDIFRKNCRKSLKSLMNRLYCFNRHD